MAAGLSRFGTDFGQAERDQQFFQLDCERPRYLAAKRSAPPGRRVFGGMDAASVAARVAALAWMRETLAREAPEVLSECAQDGGAQDELDALARALQEDFCVLSAGDDFAGSAALLDVRFPSGWRPERLGSASFQAIHAPVPGFATQAPAASSMVRSMIERGPFVRFVWTLTQDDQLDRHPDVVRPPSWDSPSEGVWLRVERQVTVPLGDVRAGVFLIRVYHYPLAELSAEQIARVLTALARMPAEIRAYKHLPEAEALAALVPAATGQAANAGRRTGA